MEEPPLGVAVVAGTDASDQIRLRQPDLARRPPLRGAASILRGREVEAHQLAIELLGIVCIVETWARDLEGQTAIVESDNMGAGLSLGVARCEVS